MMMMDQQIAAAVHRLYETIESELRAERELRQSGGGHRYVNVRMVMEGSGLSLSIRAEVHRSHQNNGVPEGWTEFSQYDLDGELEYEMARECGCTCTRRALIR